MIAPDLAVLDRLLAAGRGTIRMVTVAPELPGAVELIHHLAAQGVLAAIGHTDATYAQTMAAIDAGARVATHLFNGMRPIHHRDPGPVLAALGRPEMICEIVADGIHLHPATIAHVAAAASVDRMALITDATAAAGRPDGQYALGPVTVDVHHGVARVVETGSIAGSTLTMDRAIRHAVYDAGMTVPDAARAASTTPAALLGLDGRAGAIQAGADADVVILDDDLRVAAVMARGGWVDRSS
jgi:N-acetylglucosamine-6-phosphate deacetylase